MKTLRVDVQLIRLVGTLVVVEAFIRRCFQQRAHGSFVGKYLCT